MKKVVSLFLALICVLGLIACSQNEKDLVSDVENDDTLYAGLNAEIVDIDTENQIIYVEDCDDDEHYFEKKSAIDCRNLNENKKFIYVDYDTGHLMYIDIFDLEIGDDIIVTVYDDQLDISNNGLIVPEQIQLSTQQDK